MLIVPQTCEMLRDFSSFHENAMFYHCLHEVNHCENRQTITKSRKNDKNKKYFKCDFTLFTIIGS